MNASEAAIRFGDIYAKTLFELADESHVIEPVADDFAAMKQVLDENPEFAAVMSSPWFTQQYKMELLKTLFSGRIADLAFDFLMVAATHNRLMFLPQMMEKYQELWEARQGMHSVRATVPEAASAQRVQELSSTISEILKSKIKLEVLVDPSIMGGLVFRYGDRVIDNSVRTRLHRAITAIIKTTTHAGVTHEI
jgi:F-type H+-transporting ATPase subunit delta